MQDLETVLALGKFAETLGTIAILLIAVWAFMKGAIVPRVTLTDVTKRLETKYAAQIEELKTEIEELTTEVAALSSTVGKCRIADEVIEALRPKDAGR